MASTFSTSQKFELMATGEKAGLWGSTTNTNLQLIEEAVGGFLSLDVASADQALTISNGALSNGRNMIIKLTGTLAANRTVTVPDSIEKMYLVEDATDRSTSDYTLTFKTVSGTGVTMSVGSKMVVYSDGTNIVLLSVQKGYHSIDRNYTAVANDQLIIDTSLATRQVTLPASPSVGDEVTFIDAKGSFGSNNLIVARNGSNINSAASNLTSSTNGEAFTLVYLNATRGWSYKDKI
jgi:predicted dinucleotide-utilizing enzyme